MKHSRSVAVTDAALQVAILFGLLLLFAGCASREKPRPVEVRAQLVEVSVRAPCPDPAEYERLRSARPAPLASQPMPETARERVAKTTAQLGRYEAQGGWSDQAMAALDRCQQP